VDYLHAKFGDCTFNRFGFIALNMFKKNFFDPVTLIFDLIFIDRQGIVKDYPCAKFSDCIFSSFGFIVWTDK